MQLLVEFENKSLSCLNSVDGIILPLIDYSVESVCFFSLDEIINIKNNNKIKVFVKINKNLFNSDIDEVKDI